MQRARRQKQSHGGSASHLRQRTERLAGGAFLLLIASVVSACGLFGDGAAGAQATPATPTAPAATPQASTPTLLPGGPTVEPTAPAAAFTHQDRCVTTTLETSPGPTFIRGGGLFIDSRAPSLMDLSRAGTLAADLVCGGPVAQADIDAFIEQLRGMGFNVISYTYTPR